MPSLPVTTSGEASVSRDLPVTVSGVSSDTPCCQSRCQVQQLLQVISRSRFQVFHLKHLSAVHGFRCPIWDTLPPVTVSGVAHATPSFVRARCTVEFSIPSASPTSRVDLPGFTASYSTSTARRSYIRCGVRQLASGCQLPCARSARPCDSSQSPQLSPCPTSADFRRLAPLPVRGSSSTVKSFYS